MTMQNPQTCLSPELLRQLSQDELSPAELKDVEDHVSDCERCRQLLEVPQSDPQWQDEIVPILRTPLESPHDDRDSEGESLESVLRLLGPTDDPHMLGRIGCYEVVGVIGRGGMGVVFKAFEPALNRFVAIKMLLPHLAASGAARKRFAREGQAAAAVIDDNVMPIYSVAEWQGVPYLVTQYSRGATLQKRIQDQGPLELKEILRIGMQTARGLAAAHAQGLVHRDVKPSNILLDGTVERALLTDFGLARAVDDASITRTGIIAGTPQYMSPEQARGGSVDARSDLFGLGSVLYAMCTGRPPFRAENSYAILRMITDDEPRSIREINPDIPEWLCLLISRLMAKSPDARFGNALEVAALLEQCLAHVQQPTSLPLPASLVPHAVGRRSIFELAEEAMKTNLYTDKNGVRQLHWLRIFLFSAIAPGSLALIAVACGLAWSDRALWIMALISWGAFAGGLARAAKSVPLVQQTATPSDCLPNQIEVKPHISWYWAVALLIYIGVIVVGSTFAALVLRYGDSRPLPPEARFLVPVAFWISFIATFRLWRCALQSPLNIIWKGVLAMLGTIGMTLLGMLLWQASEAPDIAGEWTGEVWGRVVLKQSDDGELQGTFSETIGKESGAIQLKWSRLERRFNGTWKDGDDRFGELSIRLVGDEIRGAQRTDAKSKVDPSTPKLAEFVWTRDRQGPSAAQSKGRRAITNAEGADVGEASKRLIAKLPDGCSVELVGITKNTRPANEGWRPDGSKLSDVSEWPAGIIDENARDLLLEFCGLRGKPSVWLEPAGKWRNSLAKNPYRLRYTINPLGPLDSDLLGPLDSDVDWLVPRELRVALTDEPWGTWQRISVAGELLNQLGEKDLYRSSYSQIELQRVEPSRGKVKRMLLVLRQPKQHSRLFDFEICGFDTDGQEHKVQERQSRSSVENTDLEESVWSVLDSFPYDKELARFEYRLRPYRHWVTFENVSLKPGKPTDVKVKVESLPIEPTRLRVRNSDGSQALFNSVVEAKVGYPNSRLPNWCEDPTREGIVSLEKLPIGTHWLVAAAEFSNRLPFQITIPTEQPLVERRLRAVSWSSSTPKFEIGRQAVVELHDKEGEVIVVEILNQSTDPLSLSELDVELLSEFENESIRGLSPKWLMADREPFPRIKIEAGQTGRMRLNWREWARKGLWSSRNHEVMTEPGFPPAEPGKVWVKAKLGKGSSLPVAVTDPKIMLADENRRRDADRQRLQGAWRFDSEEQWGAVRAVYDARTQITPLLIEFENDTVRGAFDEPWKPLSWQMEFLEDTPLPSLRLVATASDGTRTTQLVAYRFQKEVLELCFERGSSDRIPNEFKTSEEAKTIIWRLVRATDAEPSSPGLELLKPYPKLYGLSLDMTEARLKAIVRRQQLAVQTTPSDSGKRKYAIPTGDGHLVVVMFDNGKCDGIHLDRGGDQPQKVTFESLSVTFPNQFGTRQAEQIVIKGNGECVYHIDELPAQGTNPKRPEARLTSKVDPQRMLELERLLVETNWLAKDQSAPAGPPLHSDEKPLTVVRGGVTKTVKCIAPRDESYQTLLWILRGIAKQEHFVYTLDWVGNNATERKLALIDIRFGIEALEERPGRALPYLDLDYDRFLPTFSRILRKPNQDEDEVLTAIKVATFVRSNPEFEFIARLKHDRNPQVRNAVAIAIADFGGERAIPLLVEMVPSSEEARWGLVRIGDIAVPALVELIEPGTTRGEGVSEQVVRAYLDHQKELPGPIDDRIIAAVRKALAQTAAREERTQYFKEFLQLIEKRQAAPQGAIQKSSI